MSKQFVNLTEAAKLAGVSRSKLSRDKRSGKLSVSKNHQGKPQVAISELMRVYGDLTNSDQVNDTPMTHDDQVQSSHDTNAQIDSYEAQIELLQNQIDQLEKQLEASQKREDTLLNMLQGAPQLERPKKGLFGRVVDAVLDA